VHSSSPLIRRHLNSLLFSAKHSSMHLVQITINLVSCALLLGRVCVFVHEQGSLVAAAEKESGRASAACWSLLPFSPSLPQLESITKAKSSFPTLLAAACARYLVAAAAAAVFLPHSQEPQSTTRSTQHAANLRQRQTISDGSKRETHTKCA
jgi:hypothetical protein